MTDAERIAAEKAKAETEARLKAEQAELDRAANEGIEKGKQSITEPEKKDDEKAKQELADAEKAKAETEARLKEEQAKKEAEEDPALKSKLGRKVKSLEAELTTQSQQISELMEANRKLLAGGTTKIEDKTDEDGEAPILKKDLPLYLQQEQEKQNTVAKGAEAKFIKKVYALTEEIEDEELVKEIIAEIDTAGLNRFTFAHPEEDAEKSVMKAQISVLKRRVQAKTEDDNPLNKNRDKETAATGVTGGDKVTTKTVKPVELDEEAKKFVKEMGWTPEQAQEALSGESNLLVIGKQPL